MYDPQTGRFLQRDVLAGARNDIVSLNRYTYVQDDPVGRADPSGLSGNKVFGPRCW